MWGGEDSLLQDNYILWNCPGAGCVWGGEGPTHSLLQDNYIGEGGTGAVVMAMPGTR